MANRVVNKKQALLARKETLLNDLQYYEKRIEKLRNIKANSSCNDDDSSESEQECNVDISPSVSELKQQQCMLKTCLHATQELTRVQVLQSEVNILVEDPVYDGEPPVTEEGVWREVIVECRVNLVPFTMSFNAHQPNRPFASTSYRNLQVAAVKAAHEKELSNSVLFTVTTPSEAVELFRSYSKAHRSRRASLARLAEAYADTLHMEPLPEGGYMLKCANLLEVSWTLQNKLSPVAPFHHKMKFDLEYMDESYIKTITQAHRQLSDPTIETDERTLLLSKIIKTCLDAQKPAQELHESLDSDSLNEKSQIQEDPEAQIKATDNEIMAPPKYPPKKVKAIGKENVNIDKKRPSNAVNEGNAKRAKLDSNKDDKVANAKDRVSSKVKDDAKAKKSNTQLDKNDNSSKNSKVSKEPNDDNTKTKKVNSPQDKVDQNNDKLKPTEKLSRPVIDSSAKVKKHTVSDKNKKNENTNKTMNSNNEGSSKSNTKKDRKALSDPKKSNNVASAKNDNKKQVEESTASNNVARTKNDNKKQVEESTASYNVASSKNDKIKSLESNNNKVNKVATVKNDELKRKDNENVAKSKKLKSTEAVSKQPKLIHKEIEKADPQLINNIESMKQKSNKDKRNVARISDKPKQLSLAERFNKNKVTKINNKVTTNKNREQRNVLSKKTLNSNNVKISKIPQKRLSSDNFKKNPLRISPRKPQSNSNSVNDSSKTTVGSMQKVVTNIPRLLKKVTAKPKTVN